MRINGFCTRWIRSAVVCQSGVSSTAEMSDSAARARSYAELDASDALIGQYAKVLKLKPGQSKRVSFAIQVPLDLEPGDYRLNRQPVPREQGAPVRPRLDPVGRRSPLRGREAHPRPRRSRCGPAGAWR